MCIVSECGSVLKNLPASAGDAGLIPGLGRYPEEVKTTYSTVLPWKCHGQRNLAGYSPQGHKELDTTE